ncbi:MAG TPA: peptidase M15 [Bradyrhizobium sp.]
MKNPQRIAQVTSLLCGTAVLSGWVIAGLAGVGSARIENAAGALPIEVRHSPSLIADAQRANAPQAATVSAVANADVAPTAEPAAKTVADKTALASTDPASAVELALPDSSPVQPPETPSMQVAAASTADLSPDEIKDTPASTIEIVDECLVVDICIDRYLWALYQRTPKQDTMKVEEKRKVTIQVTVKKKRKKITVSKVVTRTFTKLVPQDFTWKDPHAAEKIGMPMMDYVIGGMDRSFRLKLFHTLHAAEQAGLQPGITSAFRDDYRQSIASGLKAASDRSYHGGSSRGGYGHGLAADVVSVRGATKAERWVSTEALWKWIDAHGKEYGIGRPYLDRDPPHVAPIDGKEYASRRGGSKAQHAEAHVKKSKRAAARSDRSAKRTASAHRRKGVQVARAQVRN